MRGKIEMESRCVEDEMGLNPFFYPMGTSIIQNNEELY